MMMSIQSSKKFRVGGFSPEYQFDLLPPAPPSCLIASGGIQRPKRPSFENPFEIGKIYVLHAYGSVLFEFAKMEHQELLMTGSFPAFRLLTKVSVESPYLKTDFIVRPGEETDIILVADRYNRIKINGGTYFVHPLDEYNPKREYVEEL